jgi:hypothetical protein
MPERENVIGAYAFAQGPLKNLMVALVEQDSAPLQLCRQRSQWGIGLPIDCREVFKFRHGSAMQVQD